MKAESPKSSHTESASQASAIAYRIGEGGLEFCLITTRRSSRWGFPKGQIHGNETASETALNEALEEAGLIGRIVDESLGCYSYTKKGKKRNVVVMLMEVLACRDAWKESRERQRRWASIATARELLDRPNLLELLQVAVDRIRTGCTGTSGVERRIWN